jgi:hypothetical protein
MKLVAHQMHAPICLRHGGVDQRPARGARLRVRLRRGRLDRELAEGRDPEACGDRALRAGQLTEAVTRRRVARSLRGVVAKAERAPGGLGSAAPVCRGAVLAWREGLLGLADRLEQPGALNPCGVARALVLLTDGTGPLYNPAPEPSPGELVWWVADGLAPCPPHAWGCPVIIKTDPEHAAWTCRRCGAITTTDDPAVRPA